MSNPQGAPRGLTFACGIAPVLLAAALAALRPPLVARLDSSVYDMQLRAAAPRPPSGRVVIVDIDDRSLSTIGQWPWRRDVIARLVSRLRQEGAAAVALDMIFPEPDRFGGDPEKPSGGKSPATAPDRELADVLRGGRIVLGYGLTFDATPRPPHPCVLHPVGVAIVQPADGTEDSPLFSAKGAVCNLPILDEAASSSGFLNAAPDRDGILRRAPLMVELGGRIYPSLALASVAGTIGMRDFALHTANVNAAALAIDDRRVPVDGQGNMLLRYRGKKRTFTYLSAADVLADRVAPSALTGKIVFVGTTALGTREVVATPLDTLFAGVEVQATVADNLLEQDLLHRSPLGATLDAAIVLALGIVVSALTARLGITAGFAAAGASLVGFWFGSVHLLSTSGLVISPLCPIVGVVGASSAMTLVRFIGERRRADVAGREKTAAQRLMVQALLSLTEVRDAETGRHSRRTQQYARLLAERLATQPAFRSYLTPDRIDLLSTLAPLHDIGKVGVPDNVLNKPGALTPEELALMRTHPTLGRDVILKAEAQLAVRDDATLEMAKDIVYTHHERWDGGGYPQGLRGTDIPLAGRVMAVVDVYDAVRARRLYQTNLSHGDTVAFICSQKGTHFDPDVVDAFVGVAPLFQIISDEAAAEIS